MGYDPGKKLKGRKLHALVDTEGLPLRAPFSSSDLCLPRPERKGPNRHDPERKDPYSSK